eukprot:5367831-Ditylum_brightwellii.AAC.1
MEGKLCPSKEAFAIATPLTITFLHLPSKEHTVSWELHGMMGELGWPCVVWFHVTFDFLGCEISCNIDEIGVVTEVGAGTL